MIYLTFGLLPIVTESKSLQVQNHPPRANAPKLWFLTDITNLVTHPRCPHIATQSRNPFPGSSISVLPRFSGMITGVDQIRKDGGYGEQDKRDGQVRPDAKMGERLMSQWVWVGYICRRWLRRRILAMAQVRLISEATRVHWCAFYVNDWGYHCAETVRQKEGLMNPMALEAKRMAAVHNYGREHPKKIVSAFRL